MDQIKLENAIRAIEHSIHELTRLRDQLRNAQTSLIDPDYISPCRHEIYAAQTEDKPLQIGCKICPKTWRSLRDYIKDELPFIS